MLARTILSHTDLGLPEDLHSALVKVLGKLERGEIKHKGWDDKAEGLMYNHGCTIQNYSADGWGPSPIASEDACGTVACLWGLAALEAYGRNAHGSHFPSSVMTLPRGAQDLFYGRGSGKHLSEITVDDATTALRSYLATGSPVWE